MAFKDVLLAVLEKFILFYINLIMEECEDFEGCKFFLLINFGMGYVFEELIWCFNEENNEEVGEYFILCEVIDLMMYIIFEFIKENLLLVMIIYDLACGLGGMLMELQNFIKDEEGEIWVIGDVYLYGKEINDEIYVICKLDMMIKGNNLENICLGFMFFMDEFVGKIFDFMLFNLFYGKSWSIE